jgi:hypothetical protein
MKRVQKIQWTTITSLLPVTILLETSKHYYGNCKQRSAHLQTPSRLRRAILSTIPSQSVANNVASLFSVHCTDDTPGTMVLYSVTKQRWTRITVCHNRTLWIVGLKPRPFLESQWSSSYSRNLAFLTGISHYWSLSWARLNTVHILI